MTRIQLALELTPKQLADTLGLTLRDVIDRDGPRAQMSNFMVDPFWRTLLEFVTNRLAGYMAVKEELERKQRLDMREYHAQRNKVLNR